MRASERGIALVITLLTISLVSALGLGLALSSSAARMADHNHEDATITLNAAESALNLALRDLAAITDWSQALDGTLRASRVDGSPSGLRTMHGGETIDLTSLTNELTCGLRTACTDADRSAQTVDRPWGANNPQWRLFLHAPLPLSTLPRHLDPYVIVWVGDDGRETDGNPWIDGGGVGGQGRHVIRARVEAFGPRSARRSIDAELARVCRATEAGEVCKPGIRVQSWRLASAVP
jgi:hypothetical protein